MSAAGNFANVQAALGIARPDGIPGPQTDAAYRALSAAALAEIHARTPLPEPPRFTGIIDLNHQNSLDLAKLKAAGFAAIIHKASEGLSFRDPLYASRKADALAAGFLWGAYHFSSGDDGVAQALHFLSIEDGSDPSILLALDMEPSPGADMTIAQAESFVATIHAKTGRWPMVYGGGGLLRDLLQDHVSPTLRNCPLWLCDYRANPQIITPTWERWTLLQFTGDGQGQQPMETPGSDGADRNAFAGTEEELRAAWPFTA